MPKHDHPPFFPFYVDDFIGDGAVDAMTNEEVGIYIRLLCKAWKEDPVGTIPADDNILTRWAKSTPASWKKCKIGVLRAFTAGSDGRYHQKRMKEVWARVLENREAKSIAGRKGMDRRWHGDNRAITENNRVITDGITKHNFPTPTPIPSSNSNKDGRNEIVFSGEDSERLKARANHILKATRIDPKKPDDRELVAKAAVLWDSGEFSEEDIHHVLQSFEKPGIRSRGAYLRKCLANRVGQRCDFHELLNRTAVPICLMISQGATA